VDITGCPPRNLIWQFYNHCNLSSNEAITQLLRLSTQLINLLLHNSGSMSCLFSLPDEVLKQVMQHVSLKDRLASCCLVNRRLHAAAVATTEQLALHDTRWGPGMEWLAYY
jgi:hypothetical protein